MICLGRHFLAGAPTESPHRVTFKSCQTLDFGLLLDRQVFYVRKSEMLADALLETSAARKGVPFQLRRPNHQVPESPGVSLAKPIHRTPVSPVAAGGRRGGGRQSPSLSTGSKKRATKAKANLWIPVQLQSVKGTQKRRGGKKRAANSPQMRDGSRPAAAPADQNMAGNCISLVKWQGIIATRGEALNQHRHSKFLERARPGWFYTPASEEFYNPAPRKP